MYEYTATLIRVIDGDTVDVILDLGFSLFKRERIRLAGIDTPETRTKNLEEKLFGMEAKDYVTERLTNADKIVCKTIKEGKYGRVLGWLYLTEDSLESSISLNQELINYGYAWEYDGGKKEKDLSSLRIKREAKEP